MTVELSSEEERRGTWPPLARAPVLVPDPEPFPPDLVGLIAPEQAQIAHLVAVVHAKVLGFFTGRGESDLVIDVDKQQFTRSPPSEASP